MLAGTTPTGATLEVEEGVGTLGTLRNLLVTVHTGSKRDVVRKVVSAQLEDALQRRHCAPLDY